MGLKCERCCQCCSDPTLIVTVTHRDLLRLEFFLPEIDLFKIVAFYQLKNDDKMLEKRLMSPAIITDHSKVFLGLQTKNERCIFLNEKTCQIYDCRPQTCRSFPYTFQIREDQIYWGYSLKAKEYCPAIKEKSQINTSDLEELASQILKESEEFKQLVLIWNHLAQNNLIHPTPQLLLAFLMGKIKLTIENIEEIKD